MDYYTFSGSGPVHLTGSVYHPGKTGAIVLWKYKCRSILCLLIINCHAVACEVFYDNAFALMMYHYIYILSYIGRTLYIRWWREWWR